MKPNLQYSGTGHSLRLQWLNVQLHHVLSHVTHLTALYKVIAYNEPPNEGERRKRVTRRGELPSVEVPEPSVQINE